MTIFSCSSAHLSSKEKYPFISCDSKFAFNNYNFLNADPLFLSDLLNKHKNSKKLGDHPMVVIDAIPYVFCNEASLSSLPISVSEIAEISVLHGEIAIELYGPQARDGLILVTSKSYEDDPEKKT